MTGTGPDEFADVNEKVGAEWEAETTSYERVQEVVSHTYTPTTADVLADDARTSPQTARKHLNTLADEGFVTTDTSEDGATTYRRSSESLVVEQAADIREHVSKEELLTQISEMRDRINEFQDEYGVESLEALVVGQTNQTLSEAATTHDDLDAETVKEWQTLRRNLAFANAALSITNAERFVGSESRADGNSFTR